MKVLLINGSSHKDGCTFTALNEMCKVFKEEGVETEIYQLGNPEIKDCSGCRACRKLGKCVVEDGIVNEFVEKAKAFDGFVFGSPVYYSHPTGRILSFLDRVFTSGRKSFSFKPACAVVSCRRAGEVASFDILNKYITVSNMPLVSGNYWNNVHGGTAEEVLQDEEGLQNMRVLARNMVWMLKCIELGKKNEVNPPELEDKIFTSYIR